MNYYELKYLKEFLKIKLAGSQLVHSNTRYKNLLEFFFESQSESFRLVYSTAPGNIALFLDRWSNPKKSNTTEFFLELYGQSVTDVRMAKTDRVLTIHFNDNEKKLWFKLFSNQANVLLVEHGQIKESFKGAKEDDISLPELKQIDLENREVHGENTRQKIISLNPMIPRSNLHELIRIHRLDDMDNQELKQWVRDLNTHLEKDQSFRLLENGNTTLLGPRILPLKTVREFETINDLIAYRYKSYSHDQRLKQKKSSWYRKLKRQQKRIQSSLAKLENADKGLERAAEYEKYGHLLMANGHITPEKKSEITVKDLYDHNKEITIPLDEKRSVIENAERYYDKARRSANSYEEALRRIPELEKRLKLVEDLLDELKEINWVRDLEGWEKKHSNEFKELNLKDEAGGTENEAPFHSLEIHGFPVWIGKSARNNDLLVQMGHKEDIWLHARGVPGSHVLIRMGNKKEMPPKSVILQAASYAAYNSKAKGADIVPVIFTKKKYVRKPKGSPPGAVVVDREEVEFVSPQKPSV